MGSHREEERREGWRDGRAREGVLSSASKLPGQVQVADS